MKTKIIAIMCVLLLSGCASTPPPPRPAPLNIVAYQDRLFTEAEALVDSLATPDYEEWDMRAEDLYRKIKAERAKGAEDAER